MGAGDRLDLCCEIANFNGLSAFLQTNLQQSLHHLPTIIINTPKPIPWEKPLRSRHIFSADRKKRFPLVSPGFKGACSQTIFFGFFYPHLAEYIQPYHPQSNIYKTGDSLRNTPFRPQ